LLEIAERESRILLTLERLSEAHGATPNAAQELWSDSVSHSSGHHSGAPSFGPLFPERGPRLGWAHYRTHEIAGWPDFSSASVILRTKTPPFSFWDNSGGLREERG
jgi:hypothetical protein